MAVHRSIRTKLVAGLIVALFIITGGIVNAKIAEVEILALNDLHGHLAATDSDPGIGKIAGFIRNEQTMRPGGVLFLSAGDMYQGTMESNLLFGQSVVAELNYLGCAAMAIGNHEFDWGMDKLYQTMADADFPYLAANIFEQDSHQLMSGVKPAIMVEVNGVKVGIIGVTTLETPQTTTPTNVAGLEFAPAAPVVREISAELRHRGAEIIVLLAHMSTYQDYAGQQSANPVTGEGAELAAATGLDIDLAITGHSHRFVNGWVEGVPVVQADWAGRGLDQIIVRYDTEAGRVVDIESRVIDLRRCNIADDPVAVSMYRQQISRLMPVVGEVIGTTRNGLAKDRERQCPIGVWVTDTVRQGLGVDAVVLNNECLRQGLVAGNITMGDFYEVIPFDDFIFVLTMTGRQLRDLMEYAVETGGRYGMSYFSGLKMVYDRSRPAGQRIIRLTDGGGHPVADDRPYRVAVNDFMVYGGDGFSMLAAVPDRQNTGINLRDYLAEKIRQAKVIDAMIDDRLTMVE
ncbi:MAG: 5'-nucleotidase C-terminal domain-containing protein [Negativicutes bacterium]|nr:5'-nucleotidase C-terminal domain-containing protein [Negativicutes bacterium]